MAAANGVGLTAAAILPAAAVVARATRLKRATVAHLAPFAGRTTEGPASLRPLPTVERRATIAIATLTLAPLGTIVLTTGHATSKRTDTRCGRRGRSRQRLWRRPCGPA